MTRLRRDGTVEGYLAARRLAALVIGFALAVFAFAIATVALAHDPQRVSLDSWYGSLKIPGTSTSCCNMTDCEPTDAELRDGQWWVIDPSRVLTSNPPKSAWEAVPPERVLRRENLDGRPVLCRSPISGAILCFVPPAGV